METEVYHVPVLVKEIMAYFSKINSGVIVDGTVGGGGHSEIFLKEKPEVSIVGFDKDPEAISESSKRLKKFEGRFQLICAGYESIPEKLKEINISKVNGVLLDIGVSSRQINKPEKGFSYSKDGPLDMRFGGNGVSASEIINSYSQNEITSIIRKYGEERRAFKIAGAIVSFREKEEIKTTKQLSAIIDKFAYGDIKVKSRVFQAIRIAVNSELDALTSALNTVPHLLSSSGCLAVISYHSLEDRIVKKKFAELTSSVDRGSRPLPGEIIEKKVLRRMHKKVIIPDEKEVMLNSRARSAKLRIIEHL